MVGPGSVLAAEPIPASPPLRLTAGFWREKAAVRPVCGEQASDHLRDGWGVPWSDPDDHKQPPTD
jgi:hypothetical protein